MDTTRIIPRTTRYRLFGLGIELPFELAELPPADGQTDVTVTFGAVPESLAAGRRITIQGQVEPGKFLLDVERVARFSVSSGQEIVVDRSPGVAQREILPFLTGPVMAALLFQRGILPLHGSAIAFDGRCVAFLGPSGLGKSTLAAAFRKRGYRVLTDDICAVYLDEGGVPWVAAGFPYLKLWPDSARELGEEIGSMRPVRPGIERLAQPLGDHFCPEPSRLTHAYLLGTTNTSEIFLLPLKGSDSLKGFVLHTYSQRLLDGLGDRGRHFRQCLALAEHARVSEVKRPAWPFLIEGLVDRLERDFTR